MIPMMCPYRPLPSFAVPCRGVFSGCGLDYNLIQHHMEDSLPCFLLLCPLATILEQLIGLIVHVLQGMEVLCCNGHGGIILLLLLPCILHGGYTCALSGSLVSGSWEVPHGSVCHLSDMSPAQVLKC